jgi:hypothetical protein
MSMNVSHVHLFIMPQLGFSSYPGHGRRRGWRVHGATMQATTPEKLRFLTPEVSIIRNILL